MLELMRLRQLAQIMANQTAASTAPTSQPLLPPTSTPAGIDEKALAEALTTLKLGFAGAGPSLATTAAPMTAGLPPNVIDLQQLEAAIHRRQKEEEEAQKRAAAASCEEAADIQLQQSTNQEASQHIPQVEPEAVEIPVQQVAEGTGKQQQKKRKEKKKQASQAQEEQKKLTVETTVALAVVDQEKQLPETPATNGKKKKKKSKSAGGAVAASNADASAATTSEEKKKEAKVEETKAGFLEPEDDWVAVPGSGATFNPHSVASKNVTLWQDEAEKDQSTKKSKKKKKGK